MRVLAIDPGSEKSGWVILEDGVPVLYGWDANKEIINELRLRSSVINVFPERLSLDHLAIEYVYLRGMKIYQQTVDTVLWTGRLIEAWGSPFTLIDRKDEKMTLCGNATADDASIRIAIIDRFGGPDKAIGGKKCQTCKGKGWRGREHDACDDCHCLDPRNTPMVGCGYVTEPGPLHGVSGHVWSAIAVGLTYLAQQD